MYPKYAILMLFNVKFKYVLLFSADYMDVLNWIQYVFVQNQWALIIV